MPTNYTNAYQRQIKNRNFLAPTGFKFTLARAPKVAFFSNSANIPGLTLGEATQPTYLKDIPTPGDKIVFDDFNVRFLVDEDLKNYMELQNWIRGLGYPETLGEIYDLQDEKKNVDMSQSNTMDIYSDGTLTVLGSSQNALFKVNFSDLWPYSLTTLNFDATDTDVNYFTADVGFKYTIYNITDLSGDDL
tara:strand:+ start:130 stop:699 length:570 start_codon:yes stop_codon:yes gene_type:complete